MKATITFFALLAMTAGTSLFAQKNSLPVPDVKQSGSTSVKNTHAKTTATASRVIAASTYDYSNGFSYVLTDTLFLTYTGERGHGPMFTDLKYDTQIGQEVVSNVVTNDYKYTQTFDGNDNILTRLSQGWNVGTNSWENNDNLIYTYDGNNNILTQIRQVWNSGTNAWDNDSKYIYTYDLNNNMLTSIYQDWNSGVWVNYSQTLYSYDVNNNVTIELNQSWNTGTSMWDNVSRNTNTYSGIDMTENLHQVWNSGLSSWVNSSRHIYTYDGNHHMLTNVFQNWTLSTWVSSTMTTNVYAGDDVTNIINQSWNVGTSSWDNSTQYVMAYDGSHNVISQISQNWNAGTSSWDNDTRTQITYNGYNQFLTYWTDHWNAGIWQVQTTDIKNNYYYETYTTTGVEEAAGADNSMKVYPVPALHKVTVEKAWTEAQPFTVSIVDMHGRLIRNFNEKPTANYSRSIDVSQLPAGNYIIKLTTNTGKAAYQQFSVIH